MDSKIILVAAVIAIAAVGLLLLQQPGSTGNVTQPTANGLGVPSNLNTSVVPRTPAANATPATPGSTPTPPDAPTPSSVKEFAIVASQFKFTPAEISVNKGDTVKITLTTADVPHGFTLPDYGINEAITPGQEKVVQFVADKQGTFIFHCNIPCGNKEGHTQMNVTMTVN